MLSDQYLLQTHITRQAHLYLSSDGDRLPFEALPIARQSIACDAVTTANRPGPWPCPERNADKQVTPKSRHNCHVEVPYEQTKVLPNYPGNYTIIYQTCMGCTTSLASCSESSLSLTLRNQIGRPETKQQTFGKFSMKTKPQSN